MSIKDKIKEMDTIDKIDYLFENPPNSAEERDEWIKELSKVEKEYINGRNSERKLIHPPGSFEYEARKDMIINDITFL